MTPEDNYWATKLALAEMARYGSVSASDMYYATDERVQAVGEAHMKMNVCESVLYFELKPFAEYPHVREDGAHRQTVPRRAGRAYPRGLQHPCRVHIQSHHLYRYREGRKGGGSSHPYPHLRDEKRARGMQGPSRRPHARAVLRESIGVFDVPVIAAHCVWVDDKDIEILAKRGATVALNLPPI